MSNVKYQYVQDGVFVYDDASNAFIHFQKGPRWYVNLWLKVYARSENWRVVQITNAENWSNN